MSCPEQPDQFRRRVLAGLAWLGSAVLIGSRVARVWAQASPNTAQSPGPGARVSEREPLAQSLGYKEDASKVDKARFTNFKPGERCENCRFFQGTAGKDLGPCQIFGGRLVNAKGWCASFNAKA